MSTVDEVDSDAAPDAEGGKRTYVSQRAALVSLEADRDISIDLGAGARATPTSPRPARKE